MTYEIIDLREALSRVEYPPPTEAELWAQMIAGDISPALEQIRATQLTGWPGYVRWLQTSPSARADEGA